MSLKSILNNLIRERGEVSYGEIVQISLEEGYKVSNAERRLRKSESPSIDPIMGTGKRGNRYIKAYKWVGQTRVPETPKNPTERQTELFNSKETNAIGL